jgi:carboxymethylenebutenolidase
MCYQADARPPFPPIAEGAGGAEGREVVLTAEDGNRLGAFSAPVGEGATGGPGIVILPDIRGLHDFYRDLALRFADAGVHATAIDYFGRTAGLGDRGDDFDYMPHVRQTRPDTVALDVAAGVAQVRSPRGGAASAVFTVGFCFGGRNSFNQAARGHGLAGVIGFYGRVAQSEPDDGNAPVLLAARYACPILGLFAGADQNITGQHVEAFGTALGAAGVDHELKIYEGVPHSFFDRAFEQFRAECDDAWARTLGFIRANG